ncbi:MAG TPA: site-2 protease family protein [Candidatus Thermoplasmatota archaeon]
MPHDHLPDLVDPPKPEFTFLSDAIGERFRVHHIEGDTHRYAFFTRQLADGAPVAEGSDAVDAAFESLRVEIKRYSYVPTLQRIGEQGILTIVRIPDPPFRSMRVNWFMFMATLATVQWAGAVWWSSYLLAPTAEGFGDPLPIESAEAMSGGFLYFTLPLLSILGLHEMGHFIVARRYRVRASLPFFIPSVPPLGTFGAFISMRDPLPSRRAIFDIGLAGPLVGFVAACFVTAIGALLTQAAPQPVRPEDGGGLVYGTPVMFGLISGLFEPSNSYFHPTSFAGWAGFLVTAFNLIPAAQLDGGHVFYSMLPNRRRRDLQGVAVSLLAVMAIAAWGIVEGYVGWVLLLVIVVVTIRHPPALNQVSAFGWKRIAAGACAILVFVVSFVPAPVDYIDPRYGFEAEATVVSVDVPAGGYANASLNLTNTGNTFNVVEAAVGDRLGDYTAFFGASLNRTQLVLNRLEYQNRTVNLTLVSTNRTLPGQGAVQVVLRAVDHPSVVRTVVFAVRSVPGHPSLEVEGPSGELAGQPGRTVAVPIAFTNPGDVPLELKLSVTSLNGSWNWGFVSVGNLTANATVLPWGTTNLTFVVAVPSTAPFGEVAEFVVSVREPTWPAVDRDVTVRVVAQEGS